MVSARVNAERVVLLGWSRAILLQLAHPLVAAGVDEHSSFRTGRFAPAVRLHHTVKAMLSLTFGDERGRAEALAGINAIHRRVHGVLRHAVGVFPAGTPYSAEDPELLLWVHATLMESVPLAYERLVAPLTEAERDRFCQEAVPYVRALGVREGEPRSWRELRAYMDRMYESGQIRVGTQARQLATEVLRPSFTWALAPAARVNWLCTVGWLPPSIRQEYGFRWSARDERALERWTRAIRGIRPWIPATLATWRNARS